MVDPADPVLRLRRLTAGSLPVRRRLHLRRDPSHRLLDRLDLVVGVGERVWLVGQLDPGPSALMAVIRGQQPATGSLRLGATELLGASRRTRSRALERIEVLSADPQAGAPQRTPLQVVTRAYGRSDPAGDEAARQGLRGVMLPEDELSEVLGDLSAESQWRVRFAVLAVRAPALVITLRDLPQAAVEAGAEDLLLRVRAGGSGVLTLSATLPAALGPGERVEVVCGGRVVEVLDGASLTDPLHPFTRTLRTGGSASQWVGPWAARGCPFLAGCTRSQDCCSVMPALVAPLGSGHRVACHFPERITLAGAGLPEPTAREFAQG